MAPTAKTAKGTAINVYGVSITSSPGPTPKLVNAVIKAFVPFTTVKHRSVPMVFAHCSSNFRVTSARDHTPLRITSSNFFSSVAGFHCGHLGHSLLAKMGFPPRMAGLAAIETFLPNAHGATAIPTPNKELSEINFLLEIFIFKQSPESSFINYIPDCVATHPIPLHQFGSLESAYNGGAPADSAPPSARPHRRGYSTGQPISTLSDTGRSGPNQTSAHFRRQTPNAARAEACL